jgi:Uma2 family endonuclease
MYQLDPTFPELEIILPPTQDDLPYDDGEPMETHRHKLQMDLLMYPLNDWLMREQKNGFVSGNMFVYFSPAQVRNQDFKGPDVFAVLDVPFKERKSWVVWEEGKAPDVVIELLSSSTATHDKTDKKQIYQNQLRVPEYFWFDPFNAEDFAGFALHLGHYEPIPFDSQGRLISQSLGLALVRWAGIYTGIEAQWLRWSTIEGILLPTEHEYAQAARQQADQAQQQADQAQQQADQAQQQADQAQQQADQAQQQADQAQRQTERVQQQFDQERHRVERLAEKLRDLGIDPDQI